MDKNKALLVVSFGTAYGGSGVITLELIEKDLMEAFPERAFYRAWTSGFLRKKFFEKSGRAMPSVEEAADAMASEGVKDLLIQPTFFTEGEESARLEEAVRAFENRFEKVRVGKPLIFDEDDINVLAQILKEDVFSHKEGQMNVLMGHGSSIRRMPAYEILNHIFDGDGYADSVAGTLEYEPGISPVLEAAERKKPEKIVLAPLLVAVGTHVLSDMAGDQPESWKSRLEQTGAKVECIMKGLGEYKAVRKMYIEHAKQYERN